MNVKFLIVQGRPAGKSLDFPLGEYVFGRGDECHVRPNSDWVSRQHCLLRVTRGGAFLRDLGSRNGTLVNGVRLLEERPLRHADQVQVGPLVFEVRIDESSFNVPPAVNDADRRAAPAADTPTRAFDTAELAAFNEALAANAPPRRPKAPPASVGT